MQPNTLDSTLQEQVTALGAKDVDACMQCATCASTCPLSQGENTFPRKMYRYLQLGLKEKLLSSPEPWLCYYCGDCNNQCPRNAEPAETMMAARRWLTTQYDWTGLASKFYSSPKWEVGAVGLITLLTMLLFAIFHGPIITERVELNTFAPVHWVHIGDLAMLGGVMALLFSNVFCMYRKIMAGTKVPLRLYFTELPTFVINYFTQKRWRKCGTGPGSAWLRHFFLFSGWVVMEILVMALLTDFQTDIVHPFWHPTRLFGYYATVALLLGSGSMLYSRIYKKKENLHRYSDFTDLFFLQLIFFIAASGIILHITRLAGLPLMTYGIYVIHVSVCVAMLVIMIPFGKLSHLMYRPTAIFLCKLKEKAQTESAISPELIAEVVGDKFQTCMQCGSCTATCPQIAEQGFSPRQIMRNIALGRNTTANTDNFAWSCASCDRCVSICPRGIEISSIMAEIRHRADHNLQPKAIQRAVSELRKSHSPFAGGKAERASEVQRFNISEASSAEYSLHLCCSTLAADELSASNRGSRALVRILRHLHISHNSLAKSGSCCGEIAHIVGEKELAGSLISALREKIGDREVITHSPHCRERFSEGGAKVQHSIELFHTLLKKGTLKLHNSVEKKVTYHDPCSLGRKAGIYDAPRELLQAIPKLRLLEMDQTRENSLCCGSGSGAIFANISEVNPLVERRLQQAIATGASLLVTACPYCLITFETAVKKLGLGDKIEIQDIHSLLEEALDFSEKVTKSSKMSADQEKSNV